jgi:hypothetical protein
MRRISDAKPARGGIRNLASRVERFEKMNVQTDGFGPFLGFENGSHFTPAI